MKYAERKDEIRAKLVEVAKGGPPFSTYEEFGNQVGIWRMRGATEVLDQIAKEERKAERPDVTYVLRSATTHYPSQIGFHPAKPRPTDWQRELARCKMQDVIDWYCPGARNPY